MPDERPVDASFNKLASGYLAGESTVGLVEDVLRTNRDVGFQVFPDKQEEESPGGDHDFDIGVQGGVIQVVDYVGSALDGAIPGLKKDKVNWRWADAADGESAVTNILKFPPTKNLRGMAAIEKSLALDKGGTGFPCNCARLI